LHTAEVYGDEEIFEVLYLRQWGLQGGGRHAIAHAYSS
jgi:hypothetical protein